MKNIAVTKWILQRLSAIILVPFLIWSLFIFINLLQEDYQKVIIFFQNDIHFTLIATFLILAFFHMKIGMGEIFEDYIHNSRYKSVANLLISLFAAVLPLVTIVCLFLIIK